MMAGAVGGVHHVKNPINLARAVMEKIAARNARRRRRGNFRQRTENRIGGRKNTFTRRNAGTVCSKFSKRKKDAPAAKPAEVEKPAEVQSPKSKVQSPKTEVHYSRMMTKTQLLPENKFGTVGAVALDKDGNIAAGTSTGGMTNKKYGRVGDAPIIGAGTYADNNSCAVSATGWGEYFIRLGVARDICAQIEYRALPIQLAADTVMKKVGNLGGDGGVIAIDKFGNMAVFVQLRRNVSRLHQHGRQARRRNLLAESKRFKI